MIELLETVGLIGAVCLCFLGMVWIVERSALIFWKWAIAHSEHCRLIGCICACHDAKDIADREIEKTSKRLGLRG
jgi:hypothetical protein